MRSMATQLLAKFEENSSAAQTRGKVRHGQVEGGGLKDDFLGGGGLAKLERHF